MWDTIRGYLTFTRKERIGVLFLLLIIVVLFLLPYFFRAKAGDADLVMDEKIKEGIRKFKSVINDSAKGSAYLQEASRGERYRAKNQTGIEMPVQPAEMFYFDPNFIGEKQWRQLGISEHLSQTILHYLEKGGHFRRAEDLKKLYGLHPADYERLFPYVRIPKTNLHSFPESKYYEKPKFNFTAVKKADSFIREPQSRPSSPFRYTYKAKNYEITDINTADSAGWAKLPGIGEKLASRIVRYREKLGGFYQVEQVGETFGLPDSVFQKIKPFLSKGSVTLAQINLNAASKEILQAHPYIRWQLAKGIIDYRQQHGNFRSLDELLQLAQMTPEKYAQLKPYLFVDP